MEIIRTYSQAIPSVRFIGKKYGDSDRVNGGFGAKWGEAFGSGLFDKIEAAAKEHDIFEDSGAYIGLMRCKEGEPFEYWIGEFTSADTEVPPEMEYVDFPASNWGIGWVYGNDASGEIYGHEPEVAQKLGEAGYRIKNDEFGACWSFERYQCPRYTSPDEKGNVILDIGFLIE